MTIKIIELLCITSGIIMLLALLVDIFEFSSNQTSYNRIKEDISHAAMFIATIAGIATIILFSLKFVLH